MKKPLKKPSRPVSGKITISFPDTDDRYLFDLAGKRAINKAWRRRHPAPETRGKHTVMTQCFAAIEKGLASASQGMRYVTKGDIDERLREVGGVQLTKAQLARWKHYGRNGVTRVLADRPELRTHLERLHGMSPQLVTQGQLVRFILLYAPTVKRPTAVKFAQLYLLFQDYSSLMMPLMLVTPPLWRTVPFRRLKPYVTKLYHVTQELRRRLPTQCDRLLDDLGYPPLPPL